MIQIEVSQTVDQNIVEYADDVISKQVIIPDELGIGEIARIGRPNSNNTINNDVNLVVKNDTFNSDANKYNDKNNIVRMPLAMYPTLNDECHTVNKEFIVTSQMTADAKPGEYLDDAEIPIISTRSDQMYVAQGNRKDSNEPSTSISGSTPSEEEPKRFALMNRLHFPKVRLPGIDRIRNKSSSSHGQLVEEPCSPVNTLERNQVAFNESLQFTSDIRQRRSKLERLRRFGTRARRSLSNLTTCMGRRRKRRRYSPRETTVSFKGTRVELPPDITSIANENTDIPANTLTS